ncbi:MAG: hypothetical protein JWR19_3437 [Pedosphaera sp.]|nr:hypothetical protein [Pedosphaera sp.]
MLTSSFHRRQALPLLFCLLLFLLLAGCATKPRVDWHSRVGNFTFDQAVLELGPPDKSASLDNGTVVVEWLTQRGYSHGFIGNGNYDPYGPTAQPYLLTTTPDRFLRLTFGPDRQLAAWQRVTR